MEYAQSLLLDAGCAATAMLIFQVIQQLGVALDKDIAQCPVSYTHLDVYKRQMYRRNGPSLLPRNFNFFLAFGSGLCYTNTKLVYTLYERVG